MIQIYLDNAATTSPEPRVIQTMHEAMLQYFGNPSSIHQTGAAARDIIEDSRRQVAKLLKAEPSEIFFTSGATESINTIIEGAVKSLGIKHIISSEIEHPAVVEVVKKMKLLYDVHVSYIDFDEIGTLNLKTLRDLLQDKEHALVCLMHANNELGNLLPLKKVAEICKEKKAYFFSDTVQSIGKFDNDFSNCQLDFAVGSAHKFHGPKGVGFMFIRKGINISPYQNGGPQERNMRAGTENTIGIIGLAKALEISLQELHVHCDYIHNLKSHLKKRISEEISDAIFLGDSDGLYTILNIGMPKVSHNKMLIFNLDVEGIAVSGGSACSSGVLNVSHVIRALGKSEQYIPVRVSLSKNNTIDEIDKLVDLLKKY
jgi:cysteine desulfurase